MPLAALCPASTIVVLRAGRSIVRVQPGFICDGQRTLLTLPGDSLFPAMAGWEVPDETRFVLEGERWKPMRP